MSQAAAAWQQMSPLLEQTMMRLRQTDRDAPVLRFFEGHPLSDVGGALGASEEAAKKQVSRGRKLRMTSYGPPRWEAISQGIVVE